MYAPFSFPSVGDFLYQKQAKSIGPAPYTCSSNFYIKAQSGLLLPQKATCRKAPRQFLTFVKVCKDPGRNDCILWISRIESM